MTNSDAFNIKDFYGTVQLKEYITDLAGNPVKQITGRISVFRDIEVLGFEVSGRGTENWMVRVEGKVQTWNILGCQIRGIVTHDTWDLLPRPSERLVVP